MPGLPKIFLTDYNQRIMYIHRRHDELRDLFAKLLNGVTHDVTIEPHLTPLSGENVSPGYNKSEEARLDISARESWERDQKVFFDVRIFNPFAQKDLNQSFNNAFNQNEREKKRHYNQRVVQVERGSFTPIV